MKNTYMCGCEFNITITKTITNAFNLFPSWEIPIQM